MTTVSSAQSQRSSDRHTREKHTAPLTMIPSLLPAKGSGIWDSVEIILAHAGNCPVGGSRAGSRVSITVQNSEHLLRDTCVEPGLSLGD